MADTPRADAPRSAERGLLAALLASLLTLPALAGDPGETGERVPPEVPAEPSPAAASTAEVPDAAAGLLVVVDPETGEIVDQPSQAELGAVSEAFARSLDRSDEGLVRQPLEGGGWIVDLKGRFRHALVARPTGDGGFELLCPAEAEAAAEILAHPPAPRWEEK